MDGREDGEPRHWFAKTGIKSWMCVDKNVLEKASPAVRDWVPVRHLKATYFSRARHKNTLPIFILYS